MRIGIMGGTFDPVHNAHLMIAELAYEEYGLDRIIFMTGGNPPHKSQVTDAEIRHEMVCAAVSDNPHFEPCRYEVDRENYSYTVDTLEYLKKAYPGDELYFIIGEDSLRDFLKWKSPEEIVRMCTLLVFRRSEGRRFDRLVHEMSERLGGNIKPISAPLFEVSSTMVRRRIQEGRSVRYFLPDKVLKIIRERELYGGN